MTDQPTNMTVPPALYIADTVAEVAFCKWRNLFPDRSATRPITTINKTNGQADFYVLALVNGNVVKFVGYASDDELLNASKSHCEIWPSEALAFLNVNDLADRYGEDHVAAMLDELPHLTAEQIRTIFKERET